MPKALAAIAARAMAKDPEQRFRSARSFARELRQWLDENPTSADGEKTAPSRRRPRQRSRVVLGAAVAAGVAAVMAAVATWFVLVPAGAGAGRHRRDASRGAPARRAAAASSPRRRRQRRRARGGRATRGAPTPAAATRGDRSRRRSAMPTPTAEPCAGADVGDASSAAPRRRRPRCRRRRRAAADARQAAAAPTPRAGDAAARVGEGRKAREAREREARENDARVAAAARLVAPPTGTVRIAISPWGQVEVDGASSGAAPPLTELTLAEGRHQIVDPQRRLPAATRASVNVIAGPDRSRCATSSAPMSVRRPRPAAARASIGRLRCSPPACSRRRRRSACSTSAARPAETSPAGRPARPTTTPSTTPPNASSAKRSPPAWRRRATAPRRTSGSRSSTAPAGRLADCEAEFRLRAPGRPGVRARQVRGRPPGLGPGVHRSVQP